MRRLTRVVGYVRTSASMPASPQAEAIKDVVCRRNWRLINCIEESPEASPRLDRPELRRALEMIATGEAHALVVSSLDRLVLTISDLAIVLRWFDASDGELVIAEDEPIAIDTTTEQGALIGRLLAELGEWERSAASRRVRESLEAHRLRGGIISRQAVTDMPPLVAETIQKMRNAGLTLQQIADALNNADIPTPRGGREWRPSSLQAGLGYRRARKPTPTLLPQPKMR